MSTPLVAGAAALVREYFASGTFTEYQHANGVDCGSTSYIQHHCAPFNPSGELVKAILINSAIGINGWDLSGDVWKNGGPSYVTMGAPPDNMQAAWKTYITCPLFVFLISMHEFWKKKQHKS